MGYRLAEVGEIKPTGYLVFGYHSEGRWDLGDFVGNPVEKGNMPCAFLIPAESLAYAHPDEKLSSPLYQSILDQIDAHDSATRGERADRVYAEAMRMIGGG